MRYPGRTRTSILVGVLALFLASCGGAAETQDESGTGTAGGAEEATAPEGGGEVVEVSLGTQPWIGYGPWYVAADQGFDVDNGVRLNLVSFTTDQDLNSALAAGRMDGANMAAQTYLTLLSRDTQIEAVLLEDAAYEADAIIAGPDIAGVEDLADLQVAYEEGATSDILLRQALDDHGMTIDDVRPVFTPAADAGAAAIAGRVPAAVTYEPYLTAAMSEDDSFHIIYSGADAPGLISDLLAMNSSFVAENPDTVEALARTWQQALDHLAENQDEGRRIIAEAVGADVDELVTAFDGVDFYTVDDSVELMAEDGEYRTTLGELNDILVEQGALEQEVDFSASLNTEFVERVR